MIVFLQFVAGGLALAAAAVDPPQGADAKPPAAAAFSALNSRSWPKIEPSHVLRRPSASKMSSLYPEKALRYGVSGNVQVSCEVALSLKLKGCRVETESPPALGFGAAALRAIPFYDVAPTTIGGHPIPGGRVRLPIDFAARPPAQALATSRPPPRGPMRLLWLPVAFAVVVIVGLAAVVFLPERQPKTDPAGQSA